MATTGTEARPERGDPAFAPLGYRPALDGMRGVAILFVMAFHSFATVLGGGFIGVDMFFVLSGFLITTLLLEERARSGRISLRLFYARRALRLLPALLLVCAACMAWAAVFRSNSATKGTFLGVPSAIFYVANFMAAGGHQLGLLKHTWSLSVEEQFYVLWPLAVVVLLTVFNRKVALGLCLVTIAVTLLGRLIAYDASITLTRTTKLYYLTRADTLLVGCSVALAASLGYLARIPPVVARVLAGLGALTLVAAVVVLSGWDDPSMYRGGFTVIAAATGMVIIGVVHHPVPRLVAALSVPPLVGTGRISYVLYLWHVPIGFVLAVQTSLPTAGRAAIMWPLSFLAAGLSFVLVERPALRLKARLTPARPAGG